MLGLRFAHPFRTEGGPAYWLRAGATYNQLELESSDGELVADSRYGVGWEGAAGGALPVEYRWSVKPGLRYRAISATSSSQAALPRSSSQHLSLEVGFARRF